MTIRCRVRIVGEYNGREFVWEDPPDAPGVQFIRDDGDPSDWWWREGNMACDCNRVRFVTFHPKHAVAFELLRCGDDITIAFIEPFDRSLPVLWLGECR